VVLHGITIEARSAGVRLECTHAYLFAALGFSARHMVMYEKNEVFDASPYGVLPTQ